MLSHLASVRVPLQADGIRLVAAAGSGVAYVGREHRGATVRDFLCMCDASSVHPLQVTRVAELATADTLAMAAVNPGLTLMPPCAG